MAKINPGLLMALNALNKVDTADYDNVNKNFQQLANTMSGNSNLGNWTWSVDGSDDARQRAEQATWASYLDKTRPIYQQQTDDLQARLVNQGLVPGSEAYERAMTDLQNNQNDAMNQAAYAATLNGQNAFSQSLADSLASANFGNNAQGQYVNNIWNLLSNSMSSYDKNMQAANIVSEIYNQRAQNKKGGFAGALKGAASGFAAGAMTGNPYVAAAGAALGGFSGYNS